jgi:hypothetical protein
MVPQVPENHNLETNDNLQNGIDLSLMYLPYSSTTEAVPPSFPGNHGMWNNGSGTAND